MSQTEVQSAPVEQTLRAALEDLGGAARDDLRGAAHLSETVTTAIAGGWPSKRALIDAVSAARSRQRAAEIEQLALVSAICDAYSAVEPNPGGDAMDTAKVLFGEHLLPPSIDGLTPIAEFCGHELGPALGISPDSAWCLIWEVLALRHRHPLLWNLTLTGQVEPWLARRVAQRCARLPAERARTLDAQIGPAMAGWGPKKTLRETDRCRAALDPEAERRRQQEKEQRRVSFLPDATADAITHVEASMDAVDARHLKATLDTLAKVLRTGGAEGSLDELRAVALGHLAHPDRAARLLHDDLITAGAHVTDAGAIVNAATGETVTGMAGGGCRHGAELVLHLSGLDLIHGRGGEVVGIGPVTQGHLDELMRRCAGRVNVRPVVDLAAPAGVALYRPSDEIVWRVKHRDGREMYPYSQRCAFSTRVDVDHTAARADGGETTTINLGPLSRRSHRMKTFTNAQVVQESPGTFRWTTPLGRVYWTNAHGTWPHRPPNVQGNTPDETSRVVVAAMLRAAAAAQTRPMDAPMCEASTRKPHVKKTETQARNGKAEMKARTKAIEADREPSVNPLVLPPDSGNPFVLPPHSPTPF